MEVPSALRGLTSVFEMGTGVSPSLVPPGNIFYSAEAKSISAKKNKLTIYIKVTSKTSLSDFIISISIDNQPVSLLFPQYLFLFGQFSPCITESSCTIKNHFRLSGIYGINTKISMPYKLIVFTWFGLSKGWF